MKISPSTIMCACWAAMLSNKACATNEISTSVGDVDLDDFQLHEHESRELLDSDLFNDEEFDLSNRALIYKQKKGFKKGGFIGAVYAMSNLFVDNTIVAYGRRRDGTLALINSFKTGGNGTFLDGGDRINPLVSANAVHATRPIRFSPKSSKRARFLLAVNAGSNTVTSFLIKPNWSLLRTSVVKIPCVGPNTIDSFGRLVYVGCNDADGNTVPDQEGALYGYVLKRGKLIPLRNSLRLLNNRASDVHFSPDGRFVAVSSFDGGAATLPNESNEEIVVYRVLRNGRLSGAAVSKAASTSVNNAAGRNLASAIGFEIVRRKGKQYVVVSEAREIAADGTPAGFDGLQTGSVSTWELRRNGSLRPVQLDVLAGSDVNDGERTSCWLDFTPDRRYFFVSNTIDATIATYSFNAGKIKLVSATSAAGTGPSEGADGPTTIAETDGFIDLQVSDDGRYLYQLHSFGGTVSAYRIGKNGSLKLIQLATGNLPDGNTQGIVAI